MRNGVLVKIFIGTSKSIKCLWIYHWSLRLLCDFIFIKSYDNICCRWSDDAEINASRFYDHPRQYILKNSVHTDLRTIPFLIISNEEFQRVGQSKIGLINFIWHELQVFSRSSRRWGDVRIAELSSRIFFFY